MLNKLCRMCKGNFAVCIAYVAFHLSRFNVNASLISRSELTIHLDISHYTAYFILHRYRRNRPRDDEFGNGRVVCCVDLGRGTKRILLQGHQLVGGARRAAFPQASSA